MDAPRLFSEASAQSAESYIAVLSDPEVQKGMEGAKSFSLQAQTSAFFTDVDQNFERESHVAPKDRVHIFGIYHVPGHISKDKFEKGFIKFFEDYSDIPTIRKNFVKMEKWMPNNTVDDHIHRVGYPPPETMFISHGELETWENVVDFQNEDSFKAVLAAKSDFDLNTNASVFTADLITKFERS
ncbi:hypothetical protein B0H14DRAFT_2761991 [Mycena olivaceomarginata]|nr:hypothetical protein B0H14DRAFT_2761991 [Mycena olivaceomarginata]